MLQALPLESLRLTPALMSSGTCSGRIPSGGDDPDSALWLSPPTGHSPTRVPLAPSAPVLPTRCSVLTSRWTWSHLEAESDSLPQTVVRTPWSLPTPQRTWRQRQPPPAEPSFSLGCGPAHPQEQRPAPSAQDPAAFHGRGPHLSPSPGLTLHFYRPVSFSLKRMVLLASWAQGLTDGGNSLGQAPGACDN